MSAWRGADGAGRARRWLGPGVAALALAFLATQLYAGWGELWRQSFVLNYAMLFLSGLFLGASYFLTALVWTEVLRALGTRISWRQGFRIMYLAELGKYLPGKVWSYAGLVYLGEREGLGGPLALLGGLTMLALQTLVGLAMVVGGYAVWSGRFSGPLLAVALAALVGALGLLHPGLLQKPFAAVGRLVHGWRGFWPANYPASVASSYADRARLLAVVALNWLVAGAGMYFFINAFYGLGPGDLPLVVAIYAASWLSGYYSLIVPSGLGVREAVQAYSLTLIVPLPVGVFLALATRLWLTLGDLGAAAVAWRMKGRGDGVREARGLRSSPWARVVDPADTRGLKNEYITILHRIVLGQHLAGRLGSARLLDFGCGVGRLTGWLSQHAALAVGVDRDFAMLWEAAGPTPKGVAFVCGDGCVLPFASGAFGAIVSVGVLQQMDQGAFWRAAGELARCVAPGGVVVLIEQTGRGRRPEDEYRAAFAARGLRCTASEGVRQGRWPLIYALRYGLVPQALFPAIARMEWALTRRGIILLPAYHDRLFCFHQP